MYVGVPNGAGAVVYHLRNASMENFGGIDLSDIAKVMGIIKNKDGKPIEIKSQKK